MYVAFTTNGVPLDHVRLASVSPSAVTVEDTGIVAGRAFVLVDAKDSPQVAAGPLANGSVGYYTRSGSEWTQSVVSVPTISSDLYAALGARLASNGLPTVLYDIPNTSLPSLQLATRAASGTWTSTTITSTDAVPADFVIDSAGRMRIIYQQSAPPPAIGPALVDQPVGTAGQQIGGMWDKIYDLDAAAGLGGLVGVVSVGRDAIVVIFSDGQTTATQVAIPSTPLLAGSCSCTTGNCRYDGTTNAVALSATNDGAFWLAYAIDHIDRDITATSDGTVGPFGPECHSTITADRSMQEVVLVRLQADGASIPSIKWRMSTLLDSVSHLVLAARGTRLMLAFSDTMTRTFAFDWTAM
jgi:hypothetical protein